MVESLRKLVSGNRRRFHDQNFSLDLTYITPMRLIAMSYPASGLIERVYRNSIEDVSRHNFGSVASLDHPSTLYKKVLTFHDTPESFRCPSSSTRSTVTSTTSSIHQRERPTTRISTLVVGSRTTTGLTITVHPLPSCIKSPKRAIDGSKVSKLIPSYLELSRRH